MKNISRSEAIDILSNCAAVIIDGTVTYPYFDDEPEDFVSFSWTDSDGDYFEAIFFAEKNETVKISGSSMFLVNEEGDEDEITILCKKNLD